jgi:hypothetical protein
MTIGYRPGKSHQNADCLSRIPFVPFDPAVPPPSTIAAILFEPNPEKAAEKIVRYVSLHRPPIPKPQRWGEINERRDAQQNQDPPLPDNVKKTEISEWAKLQRADKYCQSLIDKIGVEAGEEAGDQT